MRTYTKVFKDKEKYQELEALLLTNQSYHAISLHFGVDSTTICHHAHKIGMPPRRNPRPPQLPKLERAADTIHCKRCSILFTFGGEGNGNWCDDCLNEAGII